MSLPLLYDRWLAQALGARAPGESRATCAACPLVADPVVGGEEVRYDASTKCCTYLPELPNFLVGLALADAGPGGEEGRRTIRQRIALRSGVTPLGLAMPPLFQLVYNRAAEAPPGAFGRSPSLRCPHYQIDTGTCSIWRHRNGVCSTWFCRHDRGHIGLRFWMTLKELLRRIEQDLAVWCVLELGLPAAALAGVLEHSAEGSEARLASELVHGPAGKPTARMWSTWLEHEEDFYRNCGQLVGSLDWDEVSQLCGPDVRAYALVASHQLSGVVEKGPPPRQVLVGKWNVLGIAGDRVRVCGYSKLDWVDVPTAAFETLVRMAAASPNRETPIAALEPALLTTLIEHDIPQSS